MRKWIRNIDALLVAQPTAKLVPRLRTPTSPVPDLATDESSETESVASFRAMSPAEDEASTKRWPLSPSPQQHHNDEETASLFVHYPAGVVEEMRAARELLLLCGLPSQDCW